MIIALGTIISSLQSDRLTRKFGTGKVTAVSVGTTALALWGFSVSHSFILLCLWAIPYGLGAGSVDASLNNYVALHYASKHMSWLHCMWGIGATLGPYIMGAALTGGTTWNTGYRIISVLQIILTAALIFSLPKWKKQNTISGNDTVGRALSLKEILAIPGARAIMLCFFCYCAIEQTTMLWASSYLNLAKDVDAKTVDFLCWYVLHRYYYWSWNQWIYCNEIERQTDDSYRTDYYFDWYYYNVSSFWTNGFADWIFVDWIRLCAGIPMYCSLYPEHFGATAHRRIGVQMASAYIGTCLMPPLFGLIANHISIRLLPLYLLILLILMIYMHELLERKTQSTAI